MKAFYVLALAGLTAGGPSNHNPVKTYTQAKGFAVLELFTSEGCSSCPPAENLMEVLQKENSEQNLLILSYHVDYWDRLGWKDRFSSAANTNRQNEYADRFHLNSIYTPQVVINGKKEMVGSDRAKINAALKEASVPATSLDLKAVQKENSVEVTLIRSYKEASTIMLLIQKQASTQVKGGENKSRLLNHINIVTGFQNIGKKKDCVFSFKGLNKMDYFIAVLIQDDKTGAIMNYAKAEIR